MERSAFVFGDDGLQSLIDVLRHDGREVWGPIVRDAAITVAPITSIDDLPGGWHDVQDPGRYRVEHDGRTGRFRWAVGPQTWKPQLHPSDESIMTLTQDRATDAVRVQIREGEPRTRAFLGVRACEIAAIERLDRVLLDSHEPVYRARREDLFVVAVNCSTPAATCFCSSMGTGPAVGATGFDVQLTELISRDRATYVAAAGSSRGAIVLDRVAESAAVRPAGPQDRAAVEATILAATDEQVRSVDTSHLPGALARRAESAVWSEVAAPCVACGNCTAVCPTCFCTSIVERSDLDGVVDRSRVWDSCFGLEFSRVGDHPIRSSVASRYRQWLTHKFDTWHAQFGSSGCVGCGRCISWCPVGIDVTASVREVVEETVTPC